MVIEIRSKTEIKNPLWQIILFSFSIVLILFVGMGYWYLSFQIGKVSDETKKAEEKLVKNEEEKKLEDYLFKSEKRINAFAQILPLHKKYYNIFDVIERFTHPSVQFEDINFVSEKGQAKMAGKAKDFYSLGQQLLILNDEPRIKEKIFSGISMNKEKGAVFSLSIVFDPKIFE